MKKIALLFFLLSIGVSCGGKKAQIKDIDELFTVVEKEKTEKTAFLSDELVDPVYKACVGRYLLIGSIFTDPMITAYDLELQKPVKTILSKGKAGNEILQMGSLQLLDDELIVSSGNDSKVAFMDTAQLSAELPLIRTRLLGDIQGVHCFDLCAIQGDRYIITGFSVTEEAQRVSDPQFYLLDNALNLTTGFDAYPESEYNHGMTPTEKAMGYQGLLTASATGDYVVFCSASGCVLKFFDCTGCLPVKVQEYAIEIPKFTKASSQNYNSVRFDKKNSQGVLSITASDTYFYLLYSNKKKMDADRESKIIYVFDHKGTPVKKIELDLPVTQIVHSAFDNALYAFTTNEESEPELLKINLND